MLGSLRIFNILPSALFVGGLGLLIVGTIDDVIALTPSKKLILETLVIGSSLGVARLPPVLPWPVANAALWLLWLLAVVNAFNLIDGLDGLAGGIGICAAIAVSLIAVCAKNQVLACQGLVVVGALAGFLWFNLAPAKIFMGDAGALPLGFLLGVLALDAGRLAHDRSTISYTLIPPMIMLLPLLDMAIVGLCRLLTHQPVTRRGLDHSHHKLLALGLPELIAVRICWAVAALSGFFAVLTATMSHPYVLAIAPFSAIGLGVVSFFLVDLTFHVSDVSVESKEGHTLKRWLLGFGYKRRVAELLLDSAIITAAYFGAFFIRFDFAITDQQMAELLPNLPTVLAVSYSAFSLTGIYQGMWRYADVRDLPRFARAAIVAGVLLMAAWLVVGLMLSGSIIVLFVLLLFNLVAASRLATQAFRSGIAFLAGEDRRVLVVGSGSAAQTAAGFMLSEPRRGIQIVGLIDMSPLTVGKAITGLEVLGLREHLEEIYRRTNFTEIMFVDEPGEGGFFEVIDRFSARQGVLVTTLKTIEKEFAATFNILAPDRDGKTASTGNASSKNSLV
jgi:UDP-GlcNAc:undecaprenyl-phosphate GlcNAc-1-phosphate transferase